MIETLLANVDTLLLLVCAFGALGGAALMLVLRQPMRVAMALVTTMLFLGAIYGLLGVHFIAAFQVLIYVGAVMVFMVYVIMLLDVRDDSLAGRYTWMLVPAIGAFGLLVAALGAGVWKGLEPFVAGKPYGVKPFAIAFLNDYWVHFELVSVLLVAAVVAALAVLQLGRKPRG